MAGDSQEGLEEKEYVLDVRAFGRLSRRTLPYLRRALVEFKPLIWLGVPLLVLNRPQPCVLPVPTGRRQE